MIRAFVDANVFIAAVASSTGGSALLFESCRKGFVEIVTSHLALLEAERNIRKKLPPSRLKQYHRLLEEHPLLIVPRPAAEEIRPYQMLTHEKDAPILAAAIQAKANYLVTLDRRHFTTERIRRAHLPLKVVSPREFFGQAPLLF